MRHIHCIAFGSKVVHILESSFRSVLGHKADEAYSKRFLAQVSAAEDVRTCDLYNRRYIRYSSGNISLALCSSFIDILDLRYHSRLARNGSGIVVLAIWRNSIFCHTSLWHLLEDSVRVQWTRLTKVLDGYTRQWACAPTSTPFGYVWVLFFLVWSTPVWIHPSIAANKGEAKDKILPFSVMGSILELASSA